MTNPSAENITASPLAARSREAHLWRLPDGIQARWPLLIGLSALALALIVAAASSNIGHLLHTYLASTAFVVSLSLGGLFFVILQHLTRSQWSVVVRRVAENIAAALPWLLLLFAPLLALLLAGGDQLYSWNNLELRETDPLIAAKAAYLNGPFFAVRTVFYFAVWAVLARFFWRRSLSQDTAEDPQVSLRMQKWSGPAMLAFAVTVCFAAFDWLMSLDPHWFSTIFGVYYFAGSVVGFFALLTLTTLLLERVGSLKRAVTVEHYHDLGKLLFGFVFFWAYIAFSQYLLIWYANIPEETAWYLLRQNGGWQWVSLLLLFGLFLLPFAGLMSRTAKRSRPTLAIWSGWLLLMHWVDLYWLVMPHSSAERVPLGLLDALVLLGVGAVYLAILIHVTGKRSLVPIGDPRLRLSLSFHNL